MRFRTLAGLFFLFALNVSVLAQEEPPLPAPKEAKAQFEKADTELNQAWEKLKKNLPADEFSKLKEEQRDWVQYRDSLSLSPAYSGAPEDEAKARLSSEYFMTAKSLTEERTLWLKAYNLPLNKDSLTGIWSDSFGGEMEIVEQKGTLYFSVSVVRGPTAHTGDITGIASWNLPLGWFSDKGRESSKTDETNLSFILRGNKVEVTGANTMYYHGARAYFDGTYVRVQSLPAEDQTKLVRDAKSGAKSE
jgi:uncharacterized protein YecT (DUF1311 family)